MWGDVVFFIIKLRHKANQEFAIIAPRVLRSSKDFKKKLNLPYHVQHGGLLHNEMLS
jgi:hypothetical protein